MPGRLSGKVAVITGGAGGIGRETARRFAEEGARVCVADIADELGEETARKVGGIYVHADVTNPDDVERMYRETAEEFGGIDVLFNNAGIAPSSDGSVLATDPDTWWRVLDANLTSVFLCCKHGIPHLLERGGGSVINTASSVAVMGAATSQISYTASKGGVLAMSKELGVEFARRGVRVNALCPGPVNTPLLRGFFADEPEEAARRLVHQPTGRFAEATEIANAALFLASDESSYVNASTFLVDGGLTNAYVTPMEFSDFGLRFDGGDAKP
jgi:NAD(P)-dependent dehydrogenase (short-subunit alcohol dehydrogenase family)